MTIEPRVLKGFTDHLPDKMLVRREMLSSLEQTFLLHGFVPIDTPALEYSEILLGKGSQETDKQLYRFEDNGGRDIALRFDLTVPFARFAAQHLHEIGTPFRRYHIAPVWRAEKPQRGRYREFIQCDFDIIGTTSKLADAEIIGMINASLSKLGVSHQIRINNRKLLAGVLDSLGISDRSQAVLRTVDKLEKLGQEIVIKELTTEVGLNSRNVDSLLRFIGLSNGQESVGAVISAIEDFGLNNEILAQGISELREVISYLDALGLVTQNGGPTPFCIDLGIARGLDYYTSTVFETTLTDLPEIGSICSGGRYDNLAEIYTKQALPGVGASIGIDRILGAFDVLGKIPPKQTSARALVVSSPIERRAQCIRAASILRSAGISTELSTQDTRLKQELKYANRKSIPFIIFPSEEEGLFNIKSMIDGTQKDNVRMENLAQELG